eukprot:1025259-Amorphochlora_amoeboformis.AAC.1
MGGRQEGRSPPLLWEIGRCMLVCLYACGKVTCGRVRLVILRLVFNFLDALLKCQNLGRTLVTGVYHIL